VNCHNDCLILPTSDFFLCIFNRYLDNFPFSFDLTASDDRSLLGSAGGSALVEEVGLLGLLGVLVVLKDDFAIEVPRDERQFAVLNVERVPGGVDLARRRIETGLQPVQLARVVDTDVRKIHPVVRIAQTVIN
jgi:hypothetical protein